MDKEKKEKLQEKINEVTEKVYDGVNIRGGLDNMYNVVDKIRTIALSILCIMIALSFLSTNVYANSKVYKKYSINNVENKLCTSCFSLK